MSVAVHMILDEASRQGVRRTKRKGRKYFIVAATCSDGELPRAVGRDTAVVGRSVVERS